jgi:hypothetical protein
LKHPGIRCGLLAALVIGALTGTSDGVFAQAAGPIGSRTVKSYWQENGAFFSITPTTPFDNPTGCTSGALAIIPATHPAYKQFLAAVIHAMATNTTISAWASGCYSYWGQTFPSIYALGVGQ